jgi:hypothetical protein
VPKRKSVFTFTKTFLASFFTQVSLIFIHFVLLSEVINQFYVQFYLGKKCRHSAEECKFSHEPLSETMRAILIKHIETAPREILGDFPRLTREETIQVQVSFDNSSSVL